MEDIILIREDHSYVALNLQLLLEKKHFTYLFVAKSSAALDGNGQSPSHFQNRNQFISLSDARWPVLEREESAKVLRMNDLRVSCSAKKTPFYYIIYYVIFPSIHD